MDIYPVRKSKQGRGNGAIGSMAGQVKEEVQQIRKDMDAVGFELDGENDQVKIMLTSYKDKDY